MPFCSNCGSEVKDDMKYCFNCGAKLSDNQVIGEHFDEDEFLNENKKLLLCLARLQNLSVQG